MGVCYRECAIIALEYCAHYIGTGGIRIGTQQVQSGILPQTGFFLEALEISQHFSRTSLEDAATPASGPLAESASKTTGRGKLKFRF